MKRAAYSLITSFAVIFTHGIAQAEDYQQPPLVKIHAGIVEDYPHIAHLSHKALQARLDAEDNNLIIFDTRPLKEYNVSHIKGAIQLNPKISPEDFQARFADKISEKSVVLYCSVGRRSTRLGDRLADVISKSGAQELYNLEGGLFNWHNDTAPLVNTVGPTQKIHPYNPFWGRLIENKDQISYSPR